MIRTTPLLRAVALVLLLGLLGAACTSGGGDDLEQLKEEVEAGDGQGESDSSGEVEPPPAADPSKTGRVGIIVQTNSRTWGELLDASTGDGIVVVFVQPGGPAEGAGLAPGDLITAVDGEPVTNAERAVVLLRSQPGQERTVSVTKPDGSQNEVPITAQEPGDIDQVATYTQALEERPEDPVLYYLRAQEWPISLEGHGNAMGDVQRANQLQEEFVEAIEVRANRRWTLAQRLEPVEGASEEQLEEFRSDRDELREMAMADWDTALRLEPRNLLALVHRSEALSQRGKAAAAAQAAQRAISTDDSTPEAHFALGLARFAKNEFEGALAPTRRAIDLNPFNVEYYQLLANAFMRVDRQEDARATIQAIIELVEDPAQREALLRIVEDG